VTRAYIESGHESNVHYTLYMNRLHTGLQTLLFVHCSVSKAEYK